MGQSEDSEVLTGELVEAAAGDAHDRAGHDEDFQTRRIFEDPFDGCVRNDGAHLQLKFTQT